MTGLVAECFGGGVCDWVGVNGRVDRRAPGWRTFVFSARRPHAGRVPGGGSLVTLLRSSGSCSAGRFGMVQGWEFGAQYFAGLYHQKSLSVDNLFVFVIILGTFAVPPEHQQRVLTIGIALALVLRACFIAVGAALSVGVLRHALCSGSCFRTGVRLSRHRDEDPSVDDNVLVVAARRALRSAIAMTADA